MVTSYNGWPASRDAQAIGINRSWEPIPGHRFPGGVKSGPVEIVFTYLVRQLDTRVEPIEMYAPGDEWGWYFKPSANSPKLISNHSSGTAIDYNATRHPNGRRGTWTPAQVEEIRRILAELGGVVRWLADASGTPDEMHFEIKGTPAQVAAVAARLTEEDDMTPEQSARLDRLEQKVDLVLATIADDEQSATTKRDTIAALFRRCLGIPLMASGAEQHKADAETGRRIQQAIGE